MALVAPSVSNMMHEAVTELSTILLCEECTIRVEESAMSRQLTLKMEAAFICHGPYLMYLC
jgi:hypothetical protein